MDAFGWNNMEREARQAKRTNVVVFCVFVALFLSMIVGGIVYRWRHTFSTDKWMAHPNERTRIVDDLLQTHALVGMTEAEVQTLLGRNDNRYDYFTETERYVYCLGMERGFISIDREWLVLDFSEGVVEDYCITTD